MRVCPYPCPLGDPKQTHQAFVQQALHLGNVPQLLTLTNHKAPIHFFPLYFGGHSPTIKSTRKSQMEHYDEPKQMYKLRC
jgi:hypothetical protein